MTPRVLLVRAAATPDADAAALAGLGVDVTRDPYLAVSTCTDADTPRRAAELLATLDRGSWLVLASAAGARAIGDLLGVDAVRRTFTRATAKGARFAAVGPTSADALVDLGASAVVTPDRGQTAAGLLSRLASEPPAIAVLPRSAIADTVIPTTLAARGWAVRAAAVYETKPVPVRPRTADALASGRFDVVVLRSPSAARAVHRFTGGLPGTTGVVAGGPTTALAAARLGMTVRGTAAEATGPGIAAAVAAALGVAA